jgi:tRNA A-37 threonylcarbamoyl transferase component Bud32
MSDLVGTRLGAYELLERIGGGGMAEVYRARQSTAFGREVAIKIIRPEYSQERQFRTRLLREAEAVSRLSHPHILPLIEAGEAEGTLYLVMPLVREGTLRDVLVHQGGPLPLGEALALFEQLCAAVHYAHGQGIIHRDIKPQNVLLQQGTHVLLGDFGIARVRAQEQITHTGAVIGSIAYMAPEQVLGAADARSDIYSLGVVLYELVTGRLPYTGETPFQMILQHANTPVPDPRSSNPQVSPALAEIIQTALAKNPQERFQSAAALGRAVQQVAGGAQLSLIFTPAQGTPIVPTPPPTPAAPTLPAGVPPAQPLALATTPDLYETRAAATEPGAPFAPGDFGANGARRAGDGMGVPLAPGQAAPSQRVVQARSNKAVLLAICATLAAVLILGGSGVLLARVFQGASTKSTPTATTGATATPGGFLVYTSPDGTFRISYPRGWTQRGTSSGVGGHFDGPDNASFEVANDGATSLDAGLAVDSACLGTIGGTRPQKTITLNGKHWQQEDCGRVADGTHLITDAISYKGSIYVIVYAASFDAFDRIQKDAFAPMEQSFTFLK